MFGPFLSTEQQTPALITNDLRVCWSVVTMRFLLGIGGYPQYGSKASRHDYGIRCLPGKLPSHLQLEASDSFLRYPALAGTGLSDHPRAV